MTTTPTMLLPNRLLPGDPLPWVGGELVPGGPFALERAGGKHLLILVMGSAAHPATAAAVALAHRHGALFDDVLATFFAISIDARDFAEGRLPPARPGFNLMLDADRYACTRLGAFATGAEKGGFRPHWLLVDPTLRIVGQFALEQGEQAVMTLARCIAATRPSLPAPVLVVPGVLEPDFCAALIAGYERDGGFESGFMREVNGKTIGVYDHAVKRRRDWKMDSDAMRDGLRARLVRRLVPMIKRAYQFQVTRIERFIVACYDSAEQAHFRAHRDNTTTATAHRRFAVTINLNGDYEGGDLRFPEYGAQTYRAPPGGAVVFSCSLLHEATRVTAGRRYATLPFLYDDAAATVRQSNAAALVPGAVDETVRAGSAGGTAVSG